MAAVRYRLPRQDSGPLCHFMPVGTSPPAPSPLRSSTTNPNMKVLTRNALQRVSQIRGCGSTISSSPATLSASCRSFHCSPTPRTDGVFRELTAMRVRTPWIEALRQQQAEANHPSEPSKKAELPKDRKLTPKRMSESYHSVILPLAQDPWILDTYLNASGHIRLGTIFMDLDALSGIIA